MARHGDPSNHKFSRHPGRKTAAVVAAAAVLAMSAAGCESGSKSSGHTATAQTSQLGEALNIYIPTWDTARQYANTARMLRGQASKIGEATIAFANISRSGIASAPVLAPGLVSLIDGLPKTTRVAVAFGGASLPQRTLNTVLNGNAEMFTASMAQTLKVVQRQVRRPVVGKELDFEYPSATQEADMADIVQDAESLGGHVSVDYGPGNSEGLDLRAIAAGGATINIMSLDNAVGLPTARPNAAGTQAINDIGQVIRQGVPARDVSLELPAYAETFPGANSFGQTYNQSTATEVPDNQLGALSLHSMTDDWNLLTSSGVTKRNLYSWQSPSDITRTLEEVKVKYGVTQDSLWEADQATRTIFIAAESA